MNSPFKDCTFPGSGKTTYVDRSVTIHILHGDFGWWMIINWFFRREECTAHRAAGTWRNTIQP